MSRQAYVEVATYVDPESGDLKPADQAEVFVYEAGTTKLVSIYESRSGSTLLSNPFITGENGLVEFWAVSGDYDIKFHDTKAPTRFGDYTIGWQSSPVDTIIDAGELSSEGDLEWTQDPKTGAWIPQIKANAVGANELAANSVETTEIKDGAVNENKILDGNVTSRKYKPTNGQLEPSANLILTESYVLIPGMKLEITPAVPSILFINVQLGGSGSELCRGQYFLDGVEKDFLLMNSSSSNISGSANFRVPLTAALHTIEIRAKKFGAGSCEITKTSGWTRMIYQLVAS